MPLQCQIAWLVLVGSPRPLPAERLLILRPAGDLPREGFIARRGSPLGFARVHQRTVDMHPRWLLDGLIDVLNEVVHERPGQVREFACAIAALMGSGQQAEKAVPVQRFGHTILS